MARRPRINDQYLNDLAKQLVLVCRQSKSLMSSSQLNSIAASLGLTKRRRTQFVGMFQNHVDTCDLEKFLHEQRATRSQRVAGPIPVSQIAANIEAETGGAWTFHASRTNFAPDGTRYYTVTMLKRGTDVSWNMHFALDGHNLTGYPPGYPE